MSIRPPEHPPGTKDKYYCPHCHRPLWQYGTKKCNHCLNDLLWPKRKKVKAKMVIKYE
jgi:hypothetical protein